MEQRLCVDRTPVSEAQTFAADALDKRDLNAAATKLLTKPAATSSIGEAIETHHITAVAANVAMVDARSSVSPAVMLAASEAWNAYVAIWKADKDWAAGQITEEAWKIVYERAHETLDRLSMVEAKTWLDMACKCLVLGAEEAWELNTADDPAEDGRIKRIGRQFEAMILTGGQADLAAPTLAVEATKSDLIESHRTDQRDQALLALGRKHDEAHAAWRAAVEAYRETDEQHTAFIEAAKARGGPTMADIIEGEKIPGYKEGRNADEDAFGIVGDIGLEILKHRPTSVAGLAVLARALVPLVWPTGSFEEDAALVPDEDMHREAVRHMVEACCAAAGFDWMGQPVSGSFPSDELPQGDAALLTLEAEFHRADQAFGEAYKKWSAVSDALDRVPAPDALQHRPIDNQIVGMPETATWSPRPGLIVGAPYGEEEVAVLRNLVATVETGDVHRRDCVPGGPGTEPDAASQKRVAQIVAAWDRFQIKRATVPGFKDLARLDEARQDAEDARLDVLSRLRSAPAKTLAGLLVKARVAELVAGEDLDTMGRHEHLDDDALALPLSLTADLLKLSALPPVENAAVDPIETPSLPDVAAIALPELRALHDVADLLHELCHALRCQPRCSTEQGGSKPAGDFVERLLAQCQEVMAACVAEANQRKPATPSEVDERLCILARAVIENGDSAQTAALARDLQASVG
ncbi:hypothetical protein [Methylobacterium sp. Leaf93]|uniref:hypothetical protein n=1 Tax=Methylobacterium sp. Leaf93 TaxID=1736249 RepID=UPI0006F4DC3C|nr:hypothetical protein [Methylobacterium sp. Leaf93]KQP02630.1 hypothetical protein ASF26_14470 [Methylobacterium sp. Leaf93]